MKHQYIQVEQSGTYVFFSDQDQVCKLITPNDLANECRLDHGLYRLTRTPWELEAERWKKIADAFEPGSAAAAEIQDLFPCQDIVEAVKNYLKLWN